MLDHETKILETGHRDVSGPDAHGRVKAIKHQIKFTELNIGDSYEGIIGGNVLGGSISNSEDEDSSHKEPESRENRPIFGGFDEGEHKRKHEEVTIFNPF